MSAWDPTEPTSQTRWTAKHRVGISVSAALYGVFAICWTVYVLTTEGPSSSVIAIALTTISLGVGPVFYSWNASRYVARYDNAPDAEVLLNPKPHTVIG